MNILLLDNQFSGAYNSLNIFLSEITSSLKSMGCQVYTSKSVEYSLDCYKRYSIDFSLGIGKFCQYFCGQPLYEVAQKPHYQWLIDNPLKVGYDRKSSFIQYLIIDLDFLCLMSDVKNKPIFMPLGYCSANYLGQNFYEKKKEGIAFAGQIRNLNLLMQDIKKSDHSVIALKIIEQCISKLDCPFTETFHNMTRDLDPETQKSIFPSVNSFLRAYKREYVLSKIISYPVYIVGDVQSESLINQKNLCCLGRKSYNDAFSTVSEYKFSINIEPNFGNGIHDRMIRSILGGSLLISNDRQVPQSYFSDDAVFYKYNNIELIIDRIISLPRKLISKKLLHMQMEIKKSFSWEVLLRKIFEDYKNNYF